MSRNRSGPTFRPLPFLGNPHLQTVLGFLWKGRRFRAPAEVKYLRLPDGDELALHDSAPPNWSPGMPIALLMHGMGGDHRSNYLQRLAALLYPRNVRVVRMDLRGAGAGFGRAVHFYHAGRSDDVLAALLELHRWCPSSPLWLIGFSLSGNMALKMAGEAAETVAPFLRRVAAVAPPIDLIRCSQLISQPKNRIYDRFFANQLVYLARMRQGRYPHPPLPNFPKHLSIREFDDLFTAPRCGFADACDYYRRASSAVLIPRIQTPTLILTARDDPFIAVDPFETLRVPDNIRMEIHPRGGHLGFLGYHAGTLRWLEPRIARWLLGEA